jgi:predicted  nucleic acid-binding Zn-ribbon protein
MTLTHPFSDNDLEYQRKILSDPIPQMNNNSYSNELRTIVQQILIFDPFFRIKIKRLEKIPFLNQYKLKEASFTQSKYDVPTTTNDFQNSKNQIQQLKSNLTNITSENQQLKSNLTNITSENQQLKECSNHQTIDIQQKELLISQLQNELTKSQEEIQQLLKSQPILQI